MCIHDLDLQINQLRAEFSPEQHKQLNKLIADNTNDATTPYFGKRLNKMLDHAFVSGSIQALVELKQQLLDTQKLLEEV